MPTYEYRCSQCEQILTIIHRIADELVLRCDVCHSVMEKQMSGGGYLKFTGKRFHCNDCPKKEDS